MKVLFHSDTSRFSMRINAVEVFSNCLFVAATFRLFHSTQKMGSKRTNQKLAKFPERSATLRNFVGFQTFVVKSLFPFLSFIGPFTKKVATLCSQLTL